MKKFNRRDFLKVAVATPLVVTPLNKLGTMYFPQQPSGLNLNTSADPWLEINLNNMAWNIRQIKRRVNNRPVMAVIKANAYGHGLLEIARFLEKQNTDALAVGKTSEALQLRKGGVQTPLLNLGPFSREEAKQIVRLHISQSVYTDNFNWLTKTAQASNITARVHIKIDTGLGRVGVPYYRALPFIEKIAATNGIKITGIFTPFTEDDEFDQVQLTRFMEVCNAAEKKGIELGTKHTASSAAVLSFPESYLDMVRPGITIFGQYPSTKEYQAQRINLKPVMALKSHIVYLKTLRPGDSISYHRAFIANKEMKVATIPTGYSDGYPYQIDNRGEILIGGKRCPVIGLVTANHLTADVSGLSNVELGDKVVLFGEQGDQEITVEEVAAWSNTSVYKILIRMNPLLSRIYY